LNVPAARPRLGRLKIERLPDLIRCSSDNDGQSRWNLLAEAALATLSDDDVADLLVSRTPDAHRMATWILRDPVAAEDAVQEAAVAAWDSRSRLRHADNPTAWFQRIVVNKCRDELRRRKKRRAVAEATPLPAPTAAAADLLVLRDEVGRAVARLSPDEQIVLGLRFGRDLSVPQIAAQLGLPDGTVKSRLHHALERFRSALAAERRVEDQGR
jgi:RNA polymerase sigma-70 factor, ECF subfamily